jgi:glycolate oxidase FAD binding subunit
MQDFIQSLSVSVRDAAESGRALCVTGGDTKRFYGGEPIGDVCAMESYAGIINYEPTELVITAKAGTRLHDLEDTLAKSGQMLPFEPPAFGERATIGGTVACGLSGPARPYRGAARDLVLGISCVNGKGEVLKFGGQVMKNVAGYDVSRLMVGSMGTLGIITEVSLKVLPGAQCSVTRAFELSAQAALKKMTGLFTQALPVTASAWHDGVLRVRLSGVEASVNAASQELGGEDDPAGDPFWLDLKEHRLAFFDGPLPLWRLNVKPHIEPLDLPGAFLIDWGGGTYWLKSDASVETLDSMARSVDGYVMRFRGGDRSVRCGGLDGVAMRLNRHLKDAFDPKHVLNPGRLPL